MKTVVFTAENGKLYPRLYPLFALDTPGLSLLASVHKNSG